MYRVWLIPPNHPAHWYGCAVTPDGLRMSKYAADAVLRQFTGGDWSGYAVRVS